MRGLFLRTAWEIAAERLLISENSARKAISENCLHDHFRCHFRSRSTPGLLRGMLDLVRSMHHCPRRSVPEHHGGFCHHAFWSPASSPLPWICLSRQYASTIRIPMANLKALLRAPFLQDREIDRSIQHGLYFRCPALLSPWFLWLYLLFIISELHPTRGRRGTSTEFSLCNPILHTSSLFGVCDLRPIILLWLRF